MLTLYNTLTRRYEAFEPSTPVTFYQCGPTVYWTQHIGNMRAMAMGDLVIRALQYRGYNVRSVRNYTDVGHLTGDNEGNADSGEDRMEKGARREGLSVMQIADKYIAQFEQDTARLHIMEPTIKARATDHIKEMISLISTLLAKNHAYSTEQAIYFDVSTFPTYTQLSGNKISLQQGGKGKGEISDTQKRHEADFALWFFRVGVHEHALQYWESPWGNGFPGWHIECSAMSMKYLGETIDIHMGGVEHISIHHTNEIAQSEAATGKKFVKYWLHNEHLLVDGKKMAKSEGTGYTVDEIVANGYHPLVLRYFFLSAHYRSQQNFTYEALEGAKRGLERLLISVHTLNGEGNVDAAWDRKFCDYLDNDFNIPAAFALVWEVLADNSLSDGVRRATILAWDNVLGLSLDTTSKKVPEAVVQKLKERNEARKERNFEYSDTIRSELLSEGFVIEDSPEGSRVVPAHPLAFFLENA